MLLEPTPCVKGWKGSQVPAHMNVHACKDVADAIYLTYVLSSATEAVSDGLFADPSTSAAGVTSPSKFANRSSHHIQ